MIQIKDCQCGWIEIDRYLVIRHYIKSDLDLFYKRKCRVLVERSQIDIFWKLEAFGFLGDKVVLH
jgi:hypothetical protein